VLTFYPLLILLASGPVELLLQRRDIHRAE
jgi:hypothetical protein